MAPERKHISSGMIDVGSKKTTKRIARAVSAVRLSPEAFRLLMTGGSPKGDVFETAKVAGILAAKSTPQIIPMCHPLPLNKVEVTFTVDKTRHEVVTTAEVACNGKTGVEMEALLAASVASLTIYDMMKWADKGAVITSTKLIRKSGGLHGNYHA